MCRKCDKQLTPREWQIAALLVNGLSISDIAAELAIAPSTVGSSLSNLRTKLGVQNREKLLNLLRYIFLGLYAFTKKDVIQGKSFCVAE